MRCTDVINRLHTLGVDIAPSTLRRWASEGLIAGPVSLKRRKKRKCAKGRNADWPDETVEKAAAVWAVRRISKGFKKFCPSRTYIRFVKHSAQDVYKYAGFPVASEVPSNAIDRRRAQAWNVSLTHDAYKTSDGEYALIDEHNSKKVPQPDRATWQALKKAWIFATEKAKRGIPLNEHVTLTLNLTENGSRTEIQVERSAVDEMVHQIDGVEWRDMMAKFSRYLPP